MNDLSANQIDELLDGLRAALALHPGPEDALTGKEWAAALGLSYKPAGARLDRLLREGKMERVTVMREDRRGITQPIAAYRLKS